MRIIRYPVMLVKKGDEVLLGMNKRGFSKDKWTLFGGLLQRKEPILVAAIRCLKEQSGLVVEKAEKMGKIEVKFAGVQELVQIHVFLADSFTGEITDTKEMQPKWFNIRELPTQEMWADIPFWLGHALAGKRVKAFFIYENETLLYQDIETPPPATTLLSPTTAPPQHATVMSA